MASCDSYGNVYFDPKIVSSITASSTAPVITVPSGASLTINSGGSYSIYNGVSYPWVPDLTQPGMIDTVIQKLTTTVKKDEKVVVCVDDDMSWEQVREIQRGLHENKISGVVIRGARAGVGFKGGYIPPTSEEARLDILARIGEIWSQRPELRLTDLLKWYEGQDMSNDEFATSIEVHYTKVVNGIQRKS